MSLMVQLLDPQYTSSDPRVKVCQWTKNTNEHQEKTGEIISEQIRKSILMLNRRRLDTADAIAEKV